MCGVPVHAAESYLARLIRGGHRVAIAEQVESPAEARKARGSKALVERAIVRLVTPGTLTEETLLDSGSANWLAAVARAGDEWAHRRRRHFDRPVRAGRLRGRRACRPSWRGCRRPRPSPSRRVAGHRAPAPGKGGFDSLAGERALKERFGVATLDGFGSPGRAELAAAGGLLAYLDATQKEARPSARRAAARGAGRAYGDRPGDPRQPGDLPDGRAAASPAACSASIDRCVTAPGRRLLAADLSAPLTDVRAIEARLALVQWLHEEPIRRERVRDALKAMPDIGRALGRLVAGRGSPRDLALLRDGLAGRAALKAELEAEPERPDLLERAAARRLAAMPP